MASLLEIYRQHGENADLRNRVVAAVAIAAAAVFEEAAPSETRLAWAREAVIKAEQIGGDWMWAVLGNSAMKVLLDAKAAKVAEVMGDAPKTPFVPSDEDIQATVNNLRDKYAK